MDIGDWMDFKPPARWSKGTATEFLGNLEKDLQTAHAIQERVRAVYAGPWKRHLGNHDRRIERYVLKYAPALQPLKALQYPALLEHGRFGIETLPDLYDVAPGWVSTHGDVGSLSRTPGGTALSLARQLGRSVVCGHTHSLACIPHTTGYNHRLKTLYGFEVGHMMNIRKADYLKRKAANWQSGFGILRQVGKEVIPLPIPVLRDGSFVVDGRQYGGR